jgi:hypothetical protein
VQLNSALRDRETHTESTGFRAPGLIDAVERAKDILDLGLGNSRTAIANFELDIACTACLGYAQADFNFCTGFRVSNGISDYVFNRSVEELTIPGDYALVGSEKNDVTLTLLGLWASYSASEIIERMSSLRETGWKVPAFSTASMEESVNSWPMS